MLIRTLFEVAVAGKVGRAVIAFPFAAAGFADVTAELKFDGTTVSAKIESESAMTFTFFNCVMNFFIDSPIDVVR